MKEKEIKPFIVRMRYDLWLYLKKQSIERGLSMNALIEEGVSKMREKTRIDRKKARGR